MLLENSSRNSEGCLQQLSSHTTAYFANIFIFMTNYYHIIYKRIIYIILHFNFSPVLKYPLLIRLVEDIAARLDDVLPQPYADEMRGIAEAIDVPLGQIVTINLAYDISAFANNNFFRKYVLVLFLSFKSNKYIFYNYLLSPWSLFNYVFVHFMWLFLSWLLWFLLLTLKNLKF